MGYNLNFVSKDDFEKHVADTINSYSKSLSSINLAKFNSNIIDPIKMTFDKNIFQKTYEQAIQDEIMRQRDKSNNNSIGYFHQNIFRYFRNCEVPKAGWDVIVNLDDGKKIFVEMKNKHNTMNSSSSQKIYIQMQNQILKTPENYCFLVEAIAPISRDIPWGSSINGRHVENENIRRVSIDKFYAIVTGEYDAFHKMCVQLPKTIEKLVTENPKFMAEKDTVFEELSCIDNDIQTALYKLAFHTYDGFDIFD